MTNKSGRPGFQNDLCIRYIHKQKNQRYNLVSSHRHFTGWNGEKGGHTSRQSVNQSGATDIVSADVDIRRVEIELRRVEIRTLNLSLILYFDIYTHQIVSLFTSKDRLYTRFLYQNSIEIKMKMVFYLPWMDTIFKVLSKDYHKIMWKLRYTFINLIPKIESTLNHYFKCTYCPLWYIEKNIGVGAVDPYVIPYIYKKNCIE